MQDGQVRESDTHNPKQNANVNGRKETGKSSINKKIENKHEDTSKDIDFLKKKVEELENYAKQNYEDLKKNFDSRLENAKSMFQPLKETLIGKLDVVLARIGINRKGEISAGLNFYHYLARAWLKGEKEFKILEEIRDTEKLGREAVIRLFGTYESFEIRVKKEVADGDEQYEEEKHRKIAREFYTAACANWKETIEQKRNKLTNSEKRDALKRAVALSINQVIAENNSLIFYTVYQKLECETESEGLRVEFHEYAERMQDQLAALWNDKVKKIEDAARLYYDFAIMDIDFLLYNFSINFKEVKLLFNRLRAKTIKMLNTWGTTALDIFQFIIVKIEDEEKKSEREKEEKKNEKHSKSSQKKRADLIERFNTLNRRLYLAVGDNLENGVHTARETRAFKIADSYIHFDDKYYYLKSKTLALSSFVNTQIIVPVNDRVVIYYETGKKYVSVFIKTTQKEKERLAEYILQTNLNVKAFVHDQWVRLDYDQDSHVSFEDIRHSSLEVYKFLKEFDYINEGCALYRKTIDYVKNKKEEKEEDDKEDEDQE
jgi:hypothetical protein